MEEADLRTKVMQDATREEFITGGEGTTVYLLLESTCPSVTIRTGFYEKIKKRPTLRCFFWL